MKSPFATMGPRARRILQWGGYALLAVVTFVFALQWTFPFARVKDKIIEGLASKYEVTISRVERGFWPGTMSLVSVSLATRPSKAGEAPVVFFVDRVDVDVGLLGLLRGGASVDLSLAIGKGTIEGTVFASPKGMAVDLTMRNVAGEDLTPLTDAICGVPLMGKLEADIDLKIPKGDWRQARGAIRFGCTKGCQFGDDQSKLRCKVDRPSSAAFMGDGIEFTHIAIDKFAAKVEIGGGKLNLSSFDFQSGDGGLKPEFALKLGKKFGDSEVEKGCFEYYPSAALEARSQKTFFAITSIGGKTAKDTEKPGPGNPFYVKLEGKIGSSKPRPRLCGGATEDGGGDKGKAPTLTRPLSRDPQEDVFAKPEAPSPVAPPPPAPEPPPPETPSVGTGGSGTPPPTTEPPPTTPPPPTPGNDPGGSNPGNSGNAEAPAAGAGTPNNEGQALPTPSETPTTPTPTDPAPAYPDREAR